MTALDQPAGAPAASPLDRLLGWRRAWLGIDRSAAVKAFVSAPLGLVLLHLAFLAAFAATLQPGASYLVLVGATLAGCALMPARRLQVIAIGSLAFFLLRPFRTHFMSDFVAGMSAALPEGARLSPTMLQIVASAAFVVLAFVALEVLRRRPASRAARRPVLAQLWVFGGALAIATAIGTGSLGATLLWTFIGVWSSSFWMLAYLTVDLKTKDPTPNVVRAGLMRPFWGGSATPVGKGPGFLAKFEARDADQLAAARLKGLKLMVWAAILNTLYLAADHLVADIGAIPTLHQSVLAHAAGTPDALGLRWSSLITTYLLDLMIIAVWGHVIVAVIRMAGYGIPRNTVNPLASRSLAEFWNRYFYYYKELLVDFFFYPAFLRWFKKRPALRLAFATFCAAGFGNFLYHAMSESYFLATLPAAETLSRLACFAFYTLVLSAGLIVSQLRDRRPKPEDGFIAYHVTPRLTVALFFCFLKIFDDIFGHAALPDRLAYFASLFGVS